MSKFLRSILLLMGLFLLVSCGSSKVAIDSDVIKSGSG